jgi:hypothetical protein
MGLNKEMSMDANELTGGFAMGQLQVANDKAICIPPMGISTLS